MKSPKQARTMALGHQRVINNDIRLLTQESTVPPLLSKLKSLQGAEAGSYCQDTAQVHPCSLGRDIHAAHGPGVTTRPGSDALSAASSETIALPAAT